MDSGVIQTWNFSVGLEAVEATDEESDIDVIETRRMLSSMLTTCSSSRESGDAAEPVVDDGDGTEAPAEPTEDASIGSGAGVWATAGGDSRRVERSGGGIPSSRAWRGGKRWHRSGDCATGAD